MKHQHHRQPRYESSGLLGQWEAQQIQHQLFLRIAMTNRALTRWIITGTDCFGKERPEPHCSRDFEPIQDAFDLLDVVLFSFYQRP